MLDYVSFAAAEVSAQTTQNALVLRQFRRAECDLAGTMGLLNTELLETHRGVIVLLKPVVEDYEVVFAGTAVPGSSESLAGAQLSNLKSWTRDLYKSGAVRAQQTAQPVVVTHISGPRATIHSFECLFLPLGAEGRISLIMAICIQTEKKNDF